MASYSKSKSGGNTPIGFRTPDFMKQSRFGNKGNRAPQAGQKFNPQQFRTQHKGGS